MSHTIRNLLIAMIVVSVPGLGIAHESTNESHQLKHLDSRSKAMQKNIKAMKKSIKEMQKIIESINSRSKKIRTATKETDQKLNTLAACPSDAPTRFVDNGDGTICDRRTGLMWEMKNASDGTADLSNPRDVNNTYTWRITGTTADGTAFTDFLARLNGEIARTIPEQLGGYRDWRLPTIAELQTIVDCSFGSPCINPIFGPTLAAPFYWSSTSDASNPDHAFFVFLDSGRSANGNKSFDGRVRAVRGGR